MQNSKKFLLSICCMTVGLISGCQSDAIETSPTTETEHFITDESILEETQLENQETDRGVVISEELLKTTLQSPAFQIGESVLYLSEATLEDFVNAGGSLIFGDGIESLDYMQDANDVEYVYLTYKNASFRACLKNTSDSLAPIKNSIITEISKVKDKSIICTGGIMVGDTYDSVVQKIGEYYEKDEQKSSSETIVFNYAPSFNDVCLRISFNRNTMTVEEYELTTPKNYIIDINQINEDSWLLVQNLYKKASETTTTYSSLGSINYFYTDTAKVNIQSSNKLLNIVPQKAIIGVLNNDKSLTENKIADYNNVLIIEFTGDLEFSDSDIESASFWGQNLGSKYTGVYGYCFIPNVGIDRHGNIKFSVYDEFKQGWAAFLIEQHIKEHLILNGTIVQNPDYSFNDYAWSEIELNW